MAEKVCNKSLTSPICYFDIYRKKDLIKGVTSPEAEQGKKENIPNIFKIKESHATCSGLTSYDRFCLIFSSFLSK